MPARLAIGMGIQYTPGATRLEVIDMFRLAAERGLPVYTHVRSFGSSEPGSAIEAISEVIGAAAISGASLHIVHINSSCLRDSLECLSMVAGARARGLDVTTEAYPYIAGMTASTPRCSIPGWREKLGIDYSALQLPDTGERLTKERFDELHNSSKPQCGADVCQYPGGGGQSNSESAGDDCQRWRAWASAQCRNLLARAGPVCPREGKHHADGRDSQDEPDARATTGEIYSRRPAKGRLQEGADADIIVFDAQTVTDRATYQSPMEPSSGMQFVIVGGTVLIDQGKLVPDTFPGKALLGPGKR